jgi:two-component system cell cycle sensor histidine kinase/response regulator CckA
VQAFHEPTACGSVRREPCDFVWGQSAIMGLAALSIGSFFVAIAAVLIAALRLRRVASRIETLTVVALASVLAVRSLAAYEVWRGAPSVSPSAIVAEWAAFGAALLVLLTTVLRRATGTPRAESIAHDRAIQLRGMLDNTPDPIFVKDRDGRYAFMNAANARETGRTPDEVRGRTDAELWNPETVQAFTRDDPRVFAGETVTVEQVVELAQGTRVFMTTKSPLRGDDGTINGLVGIARDITERKRAETELAELEIALEHAMPGIARIDQAGCYVKANAAYARMLGCEPHELIGRPARDTVHPDDHPLLAQMLKTFAEIGKVEGELRGVRADGSVFHKHVLVVRSNQPHVTDHYCFMRDISNRKRAEEQNVRAQKLEAVGRLAGLLAHDLNNELMTILGNADLVTQRLRNLLDDADPAFGSMKRIDDAACQAAELGRKLLAFSRQNVHQPRRVDPAHLIRNLMPALRRLAGDLTEIRFNHTTDNAHIQIDPVQFEQILTVLVNNARDAMPSGGAVQLELALVDAPESRPFAGGAVPGRAVQLTVTDTGIGMSADVMRHLFEPFFTTKPLGRGAGLGLVTVQAIVAQSGGTIEVSSEPGRGAAFRVRLPAHAGEVPPPAEEIGLPRIDAAGATILVCEDDANVRDVTCRMLEDAGYYVLAAADGREALRVAQTCGRRPHLLVTDMMLPDVNGRQLAGLLRELFPLIEVLFVSGFSAIGLTDSGAIDPNMSLLEKPFDRATLLDRVQTRLRARHTAPTDASVHSR